MNAAEKETRTDLPPGVETLDELIGCPHCDALYRVRMPASGERAVCARCHTVLIAPRRKAGVRIIALTTAMLVLVVSAVFFPFLEISVQGFANQASILDSATAFRSGPMAFLAVATAAMIVIIPVLRMILVLYTIAPIVYERPPLPQARRAFRLSQRLKPWAMAEIFALGVAVALVKVASLATIGFGTAFWMFTALVVIVIFNDKYLCTWSVWHSLDNQPQ